MAQRSDIGWTACVPRRLTLSLPVLIGVAGCTQLAAINDPYIRVMSEDPMFSWEPPVAVIRAVSYRSEGAKNSGAGFKSDVNIALTPRRGDDFKELRRSALDAMAQSGYSELVPGWVGKRYVSIDTGESFWIECSINPDYSKVLGWPTSSTYTMVNILLSAPWVL